MAAGTRRGNRVLLSLVFLLCLSLAVFASRELFLDWRADVEARAEYVALRDLHTAAQQQQQQAPDLAPNLAPNLALEEEQAEAPALHPLLEVNPDFVGWITIPGTAVDYPVVRGADNDVYLNTTFRGERNVAGAIFMDYRAREDFTTPLTILYGHNMRDGSMFASLHSFLDPAFLNTHSEIRVVTAQMEELVYRVVHARRVAANDAVYWVDFNDSEAAAAHFGEFAEGANRFLVLSTCWSSNDLNARVVVYAILIENAVS